MFTFYDVEVFKHDWLVVFEKDGQVTRIHNDSEGLQAFLSTINILVGYNNYAYDDKIIAAILRGISPYETSKKIIDGKRFNLRLQNPITLDVMQEIRLGLSLKEAQANMKENIIETPIDFDLDRPLTKRELERVFQYCENDVRTTKELFYKRESYFISKFEIVKEFKLPATAIKKTRANLSSEVLSAKPSTDKHRLKLTYDRRLPLDELPKSIIEFYENIQEDFKNGKTFQELEKEKLTYTLHSVPHVFGFGGLHGALENYTGEGNYMQIDISSYYPSLMINNDFVTNVDEFKKIYHTRQELKQARDAKQEVYKILLNSTYGAMKSKYNKLYNPQQANNVVVNGQLIMAYLIESIKPACELIQTNTDGIIIKYEKEMKQSILWLLEMFEKRFNLHFDVDLITKIAQRDVNNYVVQYQDGTIAAKGRFANWNGGTYERNSLTIIDKALVNYYMFGKRINQTVIECWKNKELDRFQHVVKAGKFDGMAHEKKQKTLLDGTYSSYFEPIQKVNRVFATNDKMLGAVYKTRNKRETQYSKVPYTSENCLVWNDDLKKLDRRKIDLNWYIKEAERFVF